jgi:tetratricopeptide (TPR) repeat protein
MKISIESARARWLFSVGVFLITGSLAFVAGRVWLAAHWNASSDPDRWLGAANLEPADADYWYRLGLYEKWDFERGDLRQAVVYYQRATEANPRSDTYWMELAAAYEALGQTSRGREAFKKAKSSHPISSDVAWRYGNFLLRRGEFSEAFAEVRRALLSDPKLTVEAVSECWKASKDFPRILTELLPAQNRYYLIALDYLLSQHQTDAALSVWQQLLGLKQAFEMPQAVPLINELIGQGRAEDAQRVWRQALRATRWPQNEGGHSSLVFNGGFEHDLLNGGFDWREDLISGAAFSFDGTVVHSGIRALRIKFDGSANLDFQNLRQFLPVEPRHRYHFAAYLRTEGISTDSGIGFAMYDAFRPATLQILGPGLVGTHPWSLVETDLMTSPETRLLAVVLRRIPSWKFDNKLFGTVWVDDVSLVPVSRETEDSRP